MPRDAFLLTEYRKLIISIFCSIVRSEYFNLPPCLVLHHFLPYKKCFEHLIFGFHRIHPNSSGKIINECNKVMFTTQGSRLGWSPYLYEYNPIYLQYYGLRCRTSPSFSFPEHIARKNPACKSLHLSIILA